ncbi:MAG: hypothetical protein WBB01_04155 [Phormidesmis sp.]
MPRFFLPLLIAVAIASLFLWQRFSAQPSPRAQPASPAVIEAASTDRLSHPPDRQTFTTGPYQFVVTPANQWQTPTATGTLYKAESRLWQSNLPHEYGPRFALVSSTGQVLLIDEFINVASPYALTLLDPKGTVIAQHSFDDLKRTLGVSSADLTRQATSGWWISAPPTLSAAADSPAIPGQRALIQTGGTTLEVDLLTGELNRRADL